MKRHLILLVAEVFWLILAIAAMRQIREFLLN